MKKRGSKRNKKRILLVLLNSACVLLCLACLGALLWLSHLLDSQRTAERWRGESEMAFSQLSCNIPVDAKLSLEDIYKFRTDMQTKFHEAALDVDSENALYVDAWSTTGKVKVSSALGSGDAAVIAVGGEFFQFHPLRLLSGSYFSEGDLMQDRVLLDPELAWLLFGGTDLQGMEMRINGIPFIVGGVVEREDDFASRKAYTSGMGLYMSYDAYVQLEESAGISSYELVAAEPVDGFARNMVNEIFPLNGGEVVENSRRYSFTSLMKVVGQFGSRSMQKLGLMFPYWENAARMTEDWAALALLLALALALTPVITAAVLLVRLLRRGKEKLSDELLPEVKDRAQEAVRVRQRRRWEKKHGRHEN